MVESATVEAGLEFHGGGASENASVEDTPRID